MRHSAKMMIGGEDPNTGVHIRIFGFRTYGDSSHFSLDNGEGIICERDYFDFIRLSHDVKRDKDTSELIFPKQRMKNLIKNESWEFDGDGWQMSMKKSLTVVNSWLQMVHIQFPDIVKTFCDDKMHLQVKNVSRKRKIDEADARKFQQYFTIPSNIELLYGIALEGSLSSDAKILCIEPSCGDGRIVSALASSPQVHHVFGCELDPVVGSQTANECGMKYPDKVTIVLKDYLQTNASDLPSVIRDDPALRVVVVANPPYTMGGGTGVLQSQGTPVEDTGRDLPLLFILHSVRVFGASKLVMLLPERCSHPSFIARVQQAIKSPGTLHHAHVCVGAPSASRSDVLLVPQEVDWEVKSTSPRSSDFQFRERLIRQAVVVQVWEQHASKVSAHDDNMTAIDENHI
jgi:hypothetical protein